LGHEQIVAVRGANSMDFVGRDRHPDTAAANEDSSVGQPLGHGASHSGSEIGIVDALQAGRAEVVDAVPVSSKGSREVLLEFVAGVIGTDG
jgi:hypothetical protein